MSSPSALQESSSALLQPSDKTIRTMSQVSLKTMPFHSSGEPKDLGSVLQRAGLTSRLAGLVVTLSLLVFTVRSRAELQFDIFLGYDSVVREAAWFPIAVEVFNDGPPFNATVEIATGNISSDQVRQIPIELPTNTRKRLTIPIFATGGRLDQWNVRLVDERGRIRAERPAQSKPMAWEGFLLGAVPSSFAGAPALPDTNTRRPEMKPQVARIQPEIFPDNPIALEGLNALYLNSGKAIALKVNQVAALLAWIHEGGHVILTVEQITDVNATPWLQQLLPCDLKETANMAIDEDVQQWLGKDARSEIPTATPGARPGKRSNFISSAPNPYAMLPNDPAFVDAQVAVATGTLHEGARVPLAAQGKPLVIQANRGRGKVTVLTFSPEREPFRSWKNKAWFWAKLVEVPTDWFVSGDINTFGGWSIDGVFGALIDSRQIRKLPVEWLLLLLVVYLVVIGPFDQWWLKKINRQMLTWITFPTYVVLFSLLIYFIGYKLRAGETEWNELHLVDILPRGERAELRGRTYVSIYSSSNATYPLVGDQPFATLRGELLNLYSGGKEGSKAQIEQRGNNFRAQIAVPVWTSLLYVNDWLQPSSPPMSATISEQGAVLEANVENLLDRPLTDIRLVVRGKVHELGALAAREQKKFRIENEAGVPLTTFIQGNSIQNGASFENAVQARSNPLGDNRRGQLENPSLVSMVASFPSYIKPQPGQRQFVSPMGLDLAPMVERGDAVLLAWAADHSLVKPLNQFKPVRTQRNTLLRLTMPVAAKSGL